MVPLRLFVIALLSLQFAISLQAIQVKPLLHDDTSVNHLVRQQETPTPVATPSQGPSPTPSQSSETTAGTSSEEEAGPSEEPSPEAAANPIPLESPKPEGNDRGVRGRWSFPRYLLWIVIGLLVGSAVAVCARRRRTSAGGRDRLGGTGVGGRGGGIRRWGLFGGRGNDGWVGGDDGFYEGAENVETGNVETGNVDTGQGGYA